MNAMTPLPLGQIIQVPNMRLPKQGAQMMPFVLDFTSQGTLEGGLQSAFSSGELDYVQSVWIDNRDNTSTLTIVFPGAGPRGQTIQAQPYSQGYYPVSPAMGDGRFIATANTGQKIDVAFYNVPMPYFTWGPTDGVLVTPSLINVASITAMAISADVQLVAGVALQTIKLYRGVFSVDQPAILKFTDGPAGALIGIPCQLTAGGSLTMQASGVPWATTSAGNDLTLNVTITGATNLYSGYGYVQD